MKLLICLLCSLSLTSFAQPPTENLFIITTDGFRWQELFTGADPELLQQEQFCPDTSYMKALYDAPNADERRKKLMPFMWNVVSKKGQLFGNRLYDNHVNVSNVHAISYPGYHELFTGRSSVSIGSNRKKINPHPHVLAYLNQQEGFAGKVAAFTSWDVFPYILPSIDINSGYDAASDSSELQQFISQVEDEYINEKSATRYDQLTFLTAKEHIQKHRPRVVFIGLGETDEFAHQGRYDLYLQQANQVDRMIAELWHWVQTTEGYKNKTTFLITTDHGRGRKTSNWAQHNMLIKGSSEVWIAVMGPGIEPLGEMKSEQQLFLKNLAQQMAVMLGEDFDLQEAKVAGKTGRR